MKKIFILISLIFLFSLSHTGRVAAVNTCDEFYFFQDGTKVAKNKTVAKIKTDHPSNSFKINEFNASFPARQPYLFRLNNGDFAVVYKKLNDEILFKNITTNRESLIQAKRKNNTEDWTVQWPRATQLATGEIVVAYGTIDISKYEPCRSTPGCLQDNRVRVASSSDHGQTWQLLAEINNSYTHNDQLGGLFQPSIVWLNNNVLGLLIVEQRLRQSSDPCSNTIRDDALGFYISNDKGRTWQRRSSIYQDVCNDNNEGYLTQLSDNRLLVVWASGDKIFNTGLQPKGSIKLTVSQDNGLTWSAARKIANTVYHSFDIVPFIQKVDTKFVLTYNKVPVTRSGDRVFTLKIADSLSQSSWSTQEFHPNLVGNGTIGVNCNPPPSNSSDLNGDGKVDIYDYNILVADFGKIGSPGWIPADIIKNGEVDLFDYNILVGNFGL